MTGRGSLIASVVAGAGVVALILIDVTSTEEDGEKAPAKEDVSEAWSTCEASRDDCLPEVELEDIEGKVWDRDAMSGKVVIVNFWATWCRPCLVEIPDLAELYDAYRDGDLVLLGIMTDHPSDDELAEFVKDTGLNYPVVRSNQEIYGAFERPEVLPTTLVYGRGGELEFRHRGAVTTEQMSKLVDELLDQKPSAEG